MKSSVVFISSTKCVSVTSTGCVARTVNSPNQHLLRTDDVISCCLDLSAPSISFRINGQPVQGMFENFNIDGLFFPVVSFSAGIKLASHGVVCLGFFGLCVFFFSSKSAYFFFCIDEYAECFPGCLLSFLYLTSAFLAKFQFLYSESYKEVLKTKCICCFSAHKCILLVHRHILETAS